MEALLTFLFMELRVECQSDFGRADVQQLVLVVLGTTEFSDDLTKRVVLSGAESCKIVNDEVVDGENVCQLDVQCWLYSREQIVELIDFKLHFSVADIDHCIVLVSIIQSKGGTYN